MDGCHRVCPRPGGSGEGELSGPDPEVPPRLQSYYPSSSLTPGYDRIVLSLPKTLPVADASARLLSTLQSLKDAMAGIE